MRQEPQDLSARLLHLLRLSTDCVYRLPQTIRESELDSEGSYRRLIAFPQQESRVSEVDLLRNYRPFHLLQQSHIRSQRYDELGQTSCRIDESN